MKATLNWTPSVTTTVTAQLLKVDVNGSTVHDTVLEATLATFEFDVNDGDTVHAELKATDGVRDSKTVTVDGVAPSAPESPTGLTLTFGA